MTAQDRTSQILKRCLVALVVVLLMWSTVGMVLSFGWHLIHHNHFNYAGRTVFVPGHSYVRNTSRGPCIESLSPFAPLFNRPFGTIFISKSVGPFSKANHYAAFTEAMTQLAQKTGHQPTASTIVALGHLSAYCLSFSRSRNQPLFTEQCVIDGSNVYLTFEGDARYLPDVPEILRSMFTEQQSST